MNRSVVSALILKDLRMSWQFLAAALVAGAGALALWQLASQALAIAATVGFFIVLIMLGILPMMMIVNERKKQTLAGGFSGSYRTANRAVLAQRE